MHDIHDERNIVASDNIEHKICHVCARDLSLICFPKDTSYRDSRRNICDQCTNAPRLSTEEHTLRLRELNSQSEAVKKQKFAHQKEYENEDARRSGRWMHYSDFIYHLRKLIGQDKLYIIDGNIEGELALYKVFGCPQKEGKTFEYLFFMPTGYLPEYSIWEFKEFNIPVRETNRGWRTILLRLIRSKLVTERETEIIFGKAEGKASVMYRRELFKFRNGYDPDA
jgi:hypothetical protein